MGHQRIGRRAAFTLIEVLVALAIIATLTAVLLPMLSSKVRDARRSALSQSLLAISQGVAEYRKAVTRYPPTLSVLTVAPTANVTTSSCGGSDVLTAINVANWRGPYLSREMISSGLQMADAVVQNALRRVTTNSSTYLLIDVAGVETQVAIDMEAEYDGNADPTDGTIRYTTAALPAPSTVPAAPNGTQNLSYAIPISGC